MSFLALRTASARVQLNVWRTSAVRLNGTLAAAGPELRKQIMDQIKVAMKAKDTSTSTTLRAIMSDVYNADKASKEDKISNSEIVAILRKAVVRRKEAADKFTDASRADLAEKELQEVNIISQFLPATLSEEKVDSILSAIIEKLPATNGPPQKAIGLVLKEFYAQVDKSVVVAELVTSRAKALMAQRA